MKPVPREVEREVLAARLRRAAVARKVLREAAEICRTQLGGEATAVMVRHRRSGQWSVEARSGAGLSVSDADLFERRESRDPPTRLARIARPLRPHGRLFGGVVVLRHAAGFTLADAGRLGRLCRTVSAELVDRDGAVLRQAVHRLFRKLGHGVAPLDVVYHGLDEACRLTVADHSATVFIDLGVDAWRVCAEKALRGPSPRIGALVRREAEIDGSTPALTAAGTSRRGQRFLLTIRATEGDDFDGWDRTILDALSKPIGAALDRLHCSQS